MGMRPGLKALAVSCLIAYGLRRIWGRTLPGEDPLQPVGEDGAVSPADLVSL